jgi:hypothetical protein
MVITTMPNRRLVRVLLATSSALLTAHAATAAQDARPCVAIVLPAVQGVEGSATEVGAAVRDLFSSYLTGPSIQVVALDARLTSQAAEEARQKRCDTVLIASVTRKRSGGGGMLGRVLGQAGSHVAWQLPVGGVAGAAVRGAAMAGAQAVTDLATNTKAKDEMKLEYRLSGSGGGMVLKPTEEKVKASVDGEDLLTPLVQRASESIAAAVSSSR